jgi:hypothetical protein
MRILLLVAATVLIVSCVAQKDTIQLKSVPVKLTSIGERKIWIEGRQAKQVIYFYVDDDGSVYSSKVFFGYTGFIQVPSRF